MGRVSVYVHPLFVFFGLYYFATGKAFVFLMVTICAVLHELGHSIVAEKNGYRLDKITLMPFGAVVQGDLEDVKPKDQIKIALAGPFINLAVGIFFVAIWWIYPESYVYTDLAVETCFSLAFINLLPAYPLDGGKVLSALLSLKLKKRKALAISKIVGVVFGIALFLLFIVTCFNKINVSLLFFSLFIIFGAIEEKKAGKYVKLFTNFSSQKLKRGMPFKKQAIDSSATIKNLMSILDQDAVNEVVIYKKGKPIATLSQEKIVEIITKHSIYTKLDAVFT